MSVEDQPFNIYREQLSSLYYGLALWDPKPVANLHKQPSHVSIGDVGYLENGAFIRMFNVTLPWNDPSNKLIGKPEKYERIKPSYFNIRENEIRRGEHYTPFVSKVENVAANRHEDSIGQMYQCSAQHRGAFLFLPYEGHSRDVIRLQVFKKYIKDNVNNWFRWSNEMDLPVEHMEDLILVTGCTLVTSWAAAAFGHMPVDSDPMTISLEAEKSYGGGAQFFWRNIRGNVEYHNNRFDSNVQEHLPQNQCVFIRGFRAKRNFFRIVPMRAAAEPLPNDSDDHSEDEIQVTRIPDSARYRDPLVGILDYIVQKCNEEIPAAEDIIAIVHDDDLRLIEDVGTLTADAIEKFLHEKQMPLIAENGFAILCGPADNAPHWQVSAVSHERKNQSADKKDGQPRETGHSTFTERNMNPAAISSGVGSVAVAIGNAVVNAVEKQLPSSQEELGDEKLNQARDLVTGEVLEQSMVGEGDLRFIEERITFVRDMKFALGSESGIKRFFHARRYYKLANEVYRDAKFLTDRASDRFRFQSQPGTSSGTEDIHRIARSLYRCRLICEDAFPSSILQEDWMKGVWKEVCYRFGDPSPNLLRQDEEFKCSSMELFNDMKTKTKSAVKSLYKFDTSPAPQSNSHNASRAQALLAETSFIYREFIFGEPPRYPYRHPIIQNVINISWFQNMDDIGIIFHDKFSPIPIEAIALVLTVIECCIDEWSTGTYKESSWKEVRHKANYTAHLGSLGDLSSHGLHQEDRNLLRQIQRDLLRAARDHAGAPPLPTAGLRKLSRNALEAIIEDDHTRYYSD